MNETGDRILSWVKTGGQRASDVTQSFKKIGDGEVQVGLERVADHLLKTGAQLGERIGLAKGKRSGLRKGAAIGVASGVIGGVALTALTLLALNGAKHGKRGPAPQTPDEAVEERIAEAILSEEDLPTTVEFSAEAEAPAAPETETEPESEEEA